MRLLFCLAVASVVTGAAIQSLCKWGILTCSMSFLGLTNASGCPKGEFQGDISRACLNSLWGHGHCYKGFEINCKYTFHGEFLNMWHTRASESTFGDCIDFCKDYAPDTAALSFEISKTSDARYFTCGCFKNITSVHRRPLFPDLRSMDWYGATYCPSFPSTPDCCTPFTGNVSNICLDSGSPDYGDGECLPGGWKIGCRQIWSKRSPMPPPLYGLNLTIGPCWEKCVGYPPGVFGWKGAQYDSACSCHSGYSYLQSNHLINPNSATITKINTTICALSSSAPASPSYLPTTSSSSSPSSSTSLVTNLKLKYNKLINQHYINNFGIFI